MNLIFWPNLGANVTLRANKRIERKSSNLNQRLPKLNEWQNFPINDKIKFQVCYLLANFFTSVDVSNDLCLQRKRFVMCEASR